MVLHYRFETETGFNIAYKQAKQGLPCNHKQAAIEAGLSGKEKQKERLAFYHGYKSGYAYCIDLTCATLVSVAADTPAQLRPQDVGRVMNDAERTIGKETLKAYLLAQELLPRTRAVLETGLYMGEPAF